MFVVTLAHITHFVKYFNWELLSHECDYNGNLNTLGRIPIACIKTMNNVIAGITITKY